MKVGSGAAGPSASLPQSTASGAAPQLLGQQRAPMAEEGSQVATANGVVPVVLPPPPARLPTSCGNNRMFQKLIQRLRCAAF